MTVAAATTPPRRPRARRGVLVALFALLVATALVTGIAGGLLRAAVAIPAATSTVAGNAMLFHAALMLCGLFGTVIAIERAVALKHVAAFVTPVASGAATLMLLAGHDGIAAVLWGVAAAVFVAVNVLLVQRQNAAHTWLLLGAAMAWLVGNVLFVLRASGGMVHGWWFLFVFATIAAERLELTRLTPRPAFAAPLLFALLTIAAGALAVSGVAGPAGDAAFGAALVALAVWLGTFDVARRTIARPGLARYMAICLLAGYAWLAVAGIAWSAGALGFATRDLALHALGLGFIVSMVMGHAPVILPAVTGLRVEFTPVFYVPLALLHASLLLRFASETTRAGGALSNAAAIAVFAAVLVINVLRNRRPSRATALRGS